MEMKSNPAQTPQVRVTEATRIPMSVPTMKLAVPELPGFFLYWHLGEDIPRALRAGYTFVEDDELEVEQKGVANSAALSGSTDMGSRISIVAGSPDEGQIEPQRLYLMKLPNAWREQDEAKRAEVNENIARSIRGGTLGADGDPDVGRRYMKQGQDLFYPKNRPR